MKKIIYAICALPVACSGGQKEPEEPRTISYEYNAAEPGAALGDVISAITILPLETTPASLISSEDLLFVHDGEYFFVGDRNRSIVTRFDARGQFLNTIGSSGRADNEYLGINEAWPAGDQIDIYSSPNSAIYSYTLDGKFIARKPFDLRNRSIMPASGGGYWAYLGYDNDIMPERVVKTDDHGVVVEKFLRSEKELVPMPDFVNHFTADGDDVLVREMFSGKIVSIDPQGVVSDKYLFDFGKYNPPARYFDISSDVSKALETLYSSDWASLHSFFESHRHSVVQVPVQLVSTEETAIAIGFRSGEEWRWVNCGTNKAPTIFFGTARALVDEDTLALIVDNYRIREFAAQHPELVENAGVIDGMDDDANPSVLLCKLK